jgi:glycosyltransferase involved in cell wall biosynthesis
MRILTIHNYYQQAGGEDVVFEGEASLLRQRGHEVVEYRQDNTQIHRLSRLVIASHAIWSRPVYRALQRLVREVEPDVAHFHNIFPLISPAAYYANRKAGVPVVQTLHNYRLLCPAATFLRNGQPCEQCLEKIAPWPAVLHSCYHRSYAQSAVTAGMLTVHRLLKTWRDQVDIYIAPTEFSRRKFIEGGLPAEKIVVKPNFVYPAPGCRAGSGGYALYVGRLSTQKGVRTLLQAWQQLSGVPLKTVGDGPLMGVVQAFAHTHAGLDIEVLGQRAPQEVLALMQRAMFLVFPSESYETFGRVAIEAFACGVPVLASRLGAMAELVDEGHTGLLFRPGDSEDLATKVRWAVEHPEAIALMGAHARRVYEAKYTADVNYNSLINIYRTAISAGQLRQS